MFEKIEQQQRQQQIKLKAQEINEMRKKGDDSEERKWTKGERKDEIRKGNCMKEQRRKMESRKIMREKSRKRKKENKEKRDNWKWNKEKKKIEWKRCRGIYKSLKETKEWIKDQELEEKMYENRKSKKKKEKKKIQTK